MSNNFNPDRQGHLPLSPMPATRRGNDACTDRTKCPKVTKATFSGSGAFGRHFDRWRAAARSARRNGSLTCSKCQDLTRPLTITWRSRLVTDARCTRRNHSSG